MSRLFTRTHLVSASAGSLLAFLAFCMPSYAAEPQENALIFTKEQLAQLVIDGQELAKTRCASCHSIETVGGSPNKEAPAFRSFASKWPLETLEESLAEGIVTGHEEMPEFVFTPEEITAFLEFLRTLQKN